MDRECLDIKMYVSAVQLDSDPAPPEVKRVKTEDVTHPDDGQDATVNEPNIKE